MAVFFIVFTGSFRRIGDMVWYKHVHQRPRHLNTRCCTDNANGAEYPPKPEISERRQDAAEGGYAGQKRKKERKKTETKT